MDGKESNVLKMDQKKRINISKIDKIFKVTRLPKCAMYSVHRLRTEMHPYNVYLFAFLQYDGCFCRSKPFHNIA